MIAKSDLDEREGRRGKGRELPPGHNKQTKVSRAECISKALQFFLC